MLLRRAALALALAGSLVGCSGSDSTATVDSSSTGGSTTVATAINGVVTYPVDSRDHVEGIVTYPQSPPVGGDHAPPPNWRNCGAYSEPVVNEQAVHSLEHGAVWITYRQDLPPADVELLRSFVVNQTHVLVSPFEGLTSPVVASAWGVQLTLDSVSDPRLKAFVEEYQNGRQTPELGAPCSGGVGDPL